MGWLDFGLGLLETAFDVAADFIPGGGAIKKGKKKLKKWTKFGKEGAKWAARGVGGIKDAFAGGGMDFGDFSLNVDNKIKDGLDKCKSDIDAQGKALRGEMQGIKSELEGALKQQGEKFDQDIKVQDAKIAILSGEQKRQAEETKKALQKQKQQLEQAINEVEEKLMQAHNKLERELDDFKNEVNERFEEHEKKILENKRKIEEERIKREEEIKEVKDKIKLTNTNLENLRQEKEELADEQLRFKAQIDQKTAQTEQAFEDLEAEYQRKTKIIEAQIEDNQETIEEFNEQINNFRREQIFQKVQQEEIYEELQEQSDILHFQKHKLELVSERMEEIHEEVHERMDKLSQKLDDRINETLNLTQDTNKKLDKLTEEVKEISNKTSELEQQIAENKLETKKVKEEAKWTNERLDNLIKSQQLLDFSSEQSAIRKIEKSLELKAEEAKLLATLNFIQETKQLIPLEFSEREWKVGIKEGTEQDIPRPEGMPLNPNSSWAKKYTTEQLQEWGWDTRLFSENETAPLTDPDKRKPEQVEPSSAEKSAEQEPKEQKQTDSSLLEKFTELEKENIERLQTIQQEVSKELAEAEKQTITYSKPSAQYDKKIESTQQKINRLNAEAFQKEQTSKKAIQKALNSPSPENKKEAERVKVEQNQVERQLEQAQTELETLERQQEFEEELEQAEAEISQLKKEELEKKWEKVQTLSEQVLEEQKEEEPEEMLPEEKELEEKFEELTQQLNQQEQAQVSSQKTMSYFMLYLIIFLLEYIVYKRNGLPGLVVLNILLLLIYQWKDQILENYQHLYNWLLIIAYVVGNVLTYNAIENPDYKWPAVIGYNLCIAGIYAYNWYQQHGINLKITKTKQAIKKSEEKLVEKKLEIKEQEIKQQIEVRKEAEKLNEQLVKENLDKIQGNLVGSQSSMTWQKIIKKYPEFKDKSLLLKEFEKAKKILKREVSEQDQVLLTKLTKIPFPNSEEQNLLTQLYLTTEQFIVLSSQAQYLTRKEKETLPEIYPTLTTPQKLQLLNSGLNNLEINTLSKKQSFVQLNHTLYQEKANFGLSAPEKENILRLLITSLDLSAEQRTSLESMGIRFFDASNWEVSEEQKNSLLSFGCSKVQLTEEQQTDLLNTEQLRNFSLTEPQKNILQSLAPLTREDKYSTESLQLLRSLQLKPTTLTFLTNEEILPNPNTDFGEVKSPYLPLKTKFLEGEQNALEKLTELQTKQKKQEEVEKSKQSIILSLAEYAEKIKQENEELHTLTYSLTDWVSIGAIKEWQKDILLTLGLKTVPKYNYFELLIFTVENFTNTPFTEFLISVPQLQADYRQYLELQQNQPITINKTLWTKFVSSQSAQQREVLNNLDLAELINQQIKKHLTNYQPLEKAEWEDWLNISLNFSERLVKSWQEWGFDYETTKEWINIGLKTIDYQFADWLRTEINLTPEEVLNNANETELREQFTKFQEKAPNKTSSRYDNLFANLSKEEAERQRKKLEYEEKQKQFQEQERKRRENKLSEKDRKLKEDEERRQKERELQAQEAEKKRLADEARTKALQVEQETFLNTKLKNIEARKIAAEQALANQKKENKLEEQKKKDQIAKMEKENQEEQARLAKQSQLIEEELNKKLAQIALEDEEERQRITKKANEEKARIEADMLEKQRKNEEELKKRENELFRQREERQREIQKMEDEARIANEDAQATEELLRQEKAKQADLYASQQRQYQARINKGAVDEKKHDNQDKAIRSVLNYYVNDDEFRQSFQGGSYFQNEGKYLPQVSEIFNRYSSIRVNISNFFTNSGKNKVCGNSAWTYYLDTELQKTSSAVGSGWYTKSQLEERIRKVIGENF